MLHKRKKQFDTRVSHVVEWMMDQQKRQLECNSFCALCTVECCTAEEVNNSLNFLHQRRNKLLLCGRDSLERKRIGNKRLYNRRNPAETFQLIFFAVEKKLFEYRLKKGKGKRHIKIMKERVEIVVQLHKQSLLV